MTTAWAAAVSRRGFLKIGGAAAGLLALPALRARAQDAKPAKQIPVGLQLYSVRTEAPKDLPGVLKQIAAAGYAGVEFAGYYSKSAAELRKLLDDCGLKCCGTHTAIGTLRGDALKGTIEFNQALGNPYLIVPGLPKQEKAQGWIDLAKEFTDLATRVKAQGMYVGYHAHGGDFARVEGQVPWDLFFGNAGPDVVMQMDTGNCLGGGGDPVALLRKYPGRALTVHLKEHGGTGIVGGGTVAWNEVFALCESTGNTRWYIIEHEGAGNPLDNIRFSREGLKKLGR